MVKLNTVKPNVAKLNTVKLNTVKLNKDAEVTNRDNRVCTSTSCWWYDIGATLGSCQCPSGCKYKPRWS